MLWLKCVPPKRYVDVLTPGARDRDLIWKWGPCIYSQVRMKSYWDRVSPKYHDWDSLRRERFGERQTEGSEPCEKGGRN